MLAASGAQLERWLARPQSRQPHRVDRIPHRAVPPGRVLWGGWVHAVANSQSIAPARHQAERSQHVATGPSGGRASSSPRLVRT
jgi:hypothetical protein